MQSMYIMYMKGREGSEDLLRYLIYVYKYAHTYTHMRIYTYVYTCIHMYIHIHTYIHIYTCIHKYIYTHIYIHIYTYTYIYIYIYIYIHVYIYIYICMYTRRWYEIATTPRGRHAANSVPPALRTSHEAHTQRHAPHSRSTSGSVGSRDTHQISIQSNEPYVLGASLTPQLPTHTPHTSSARLKSTAAARTVSGRSLFCLSVSVPPSLYCESVENAWKLCVRISVCVFGVSMCLCHIYYSTDVCVSHAYV